MSICNVVLDSSRAMVAVDTVAEFEGNIHTAMKMLPMPHARSIVLGRGSVAFLMSIFTGCYIGGEDFDSLLTLLCQSRDKIAAGPLHAHLERVLGAERARELDKNEMTLVGWSRGANRMKGWATMQTESGGPFSDREIKHALCGPSVDVSFGNSLRAGDEERMLAMARLQMEYVRSRGIPGHGGELIIAHIDRDSIRSSIAATL